MCMRECVYECLCSSRIQRFKDTRIQWFKDSITKVSISLEGGGGVGLVIPPSSISCVSATASSVAEQRLLGPLGQLCFGGPYFNFNTPE